MFSVFRTNNPILDAERYNSCHDGQRISCAGGCGESFYVGSTAFYGDKAWLIDGEWYCEECAREKFYKEVKV